MSDQQLKTAEAIWLHYYNDYLREHAFITEDEWRKMRRQIEQRQAALRKDMLV